MSSTCSCLEIWKKVWIPGRVEPRVRGIGLVANTTLELDMHLEALT
jgi:hypothetical protein